MTPKEYEQIVHKTAIYPQEVKNFGIIYAFLGLWDEIEEFVEKLDAKHTVESHTELLKEAGDVLWYIAAICKELNIDFDMIMQIATNESDLRELNESKIYGMLKKFYRDGKMLDTTYIGEYLITAVVNVFTSMSSDYKANIQEAMRMNYTKLIDRKERNVISGDGDNR